MLYIICMYLLTLRMYLQFSSKFFFFLFFFLFIYFSFFLFYFFNPQRETGIKNIQQNSSKRISVGKDIDLVADAEDHRKSKYTDESNGSTGGGGGGGGSKSIFSHGNSSQSHSLVVNKYNRHSSLCMNDVEQKTFETVLSCG